MMKSIVSYSRRLTTIYEDKLPENIIYPKSLKFVQTITITYDHVNAT